MDVTPVLVLFVGILYIQVIHATICYETNHNTGALRTVPIYCEDSEYCCGNEVYRECCDEFDDVGTIIGAVIGIIILVAVVTVIICIIKQSNRVRKGANIRPYPVTSGSVITQRYPHGPAPGTKLQPRNHHNYVVPPARNNTTNVPMTLNVRQDAMTPIPSGQGHVPPAFTYTPPQYAMR